MMVSLASRLASQGSSPVGSFLPYGSGTPPTGYLACDGSAVSRTTYASLFSIIGVSFGPGDGSTTFNLPDSRGLFLRGAGSQVVSAKTFNGGSVGNKQKDGTSANGLSIATVSTPSLSIDTTDLTHTHGYSDLTTNFTSMLVNFGGTSDPGTFSTVGTNSSEAENTGSALGNHNHTVTPSITSIVTSLSATDTETKPAHLTAAFYIKY